MAATLLNVPGLGWTDASGNPLSGGKIYIYQAGTIDTVKASYPTRDDATAQSNANTHPVVLDSAGRPATDIWVDGRYKAVVTDAADLVIATVADLGGTDSDDLIPRDYVGGLAVTVSGGDAEHDFVVAAGEARDDADSDDMVLVSSLTKQVDVAWAAGSTAGAVDTGTVAAGTDYYIYLIKSSGTGAVDVLLSASASAPTMPSGYDKKQLIARLVTDASANISAVYGRDRTISGVGLAKGVLSNATISGAAVAAPWRPRGLRLTNNGTDAANDIDIAAGAVLDSTAAVDIVLATSLTKRLDANWAAGTNAGGLDTGAKANSTLYAVWAIHPTVVSGASDSLFSTSFTTPTMPGGYSYKRLIGAIVTNGSGAIVPFLQVGDYFRYLASPIIDVNDGTMANGVVETATLSAPPLAKAHVYGYLSNNTSTTTSGSLMIRTVGSSEDVGNNAQSWAFTGSAANFDDITIIGEVLVDGNRQVEYAAEVLSGSATVQIRTFGFAMLTRSDPV